MKTTTKKWLITAALLILIGCIIFGGVMAMFGFDFKKLSTCEFETNKYEITDNFSDISVDTNTAEVEFLVSDDEKIKVECHEEKSNKHSVLVEENKLIIKLVNRKKWYDYIGVNFETPKITVYLPKGEYGALYVNGSTGDIKIAKDFQFKCADISLSTGKTQFSASSLGIVKISASTGDVTVKNTAVGGLDVTVTTGSIKLSGVTSKGGVRAKVSTGKTKLTDIDCKNLVSSGSTGDIILDNVVANDKFSVSRSTGDIEIKGADANEIYLETDTGDIEGFLFSDKIFIAKTDTGDIDVPKTTTGGKCEINTDTGDIKIKIKKQ